MGMILALILLPSTFLIEVIIVNVPAALCGGVPLTSKPPLAFGVIVPAEVVPSPQSMIAVKSLTCPFGSASVNEATLAVNEASTLALMLMPVETAIGSA